MPISSEEARALADLLPDGLACDDVRSRLLTLVDLMRMLTDDGHPLSNADIRAVLSARFGEACCPSENTLNADLRVLREQGVLGCRVHTGPVGSWCENEQLPANKVRLLLNSVQASRFLTQAQSYGLQEDLANLVSRHQEDMLFGDVFVEQRLRATAQQVFETNDLIARAIREGRKLEFEYAYNGFDGAPHMLAGDDGSTLRIETPIGLIYSYGNYYLESHSSEPWRHGIELMHSRVDRMYNVRVSEQPAERSEDVREARRTLEKRVSESMEMVDGPLRTVFLRVRADCTNVMFDKFGFGLRFGQFEGELGAVTTTAVTCVDVAESFTFFRWLTSAGDGIVFVRPESALWVQSGPWPDRVKKMPLADLQAHHDAMRAGYLAFLDRARSPYEV